MVRRAIYPSERPADHDYGPQPHPVDLSSSVIIYIFITCNASARSPRSRLMDPALSAQTAPSLQVRLSGCRPPGFATPIRYISPFVLTWSLSLSQSAATGGADIHLMGTMMIFPPIMFRRAVKSSSRRWICLGIRREEKSVWESRAPLSPAHVGILRADFGISVVVQPSTTRVFSDREYLAVGGDPGNRRMDRHGFERLCRRGPS